MTTTFPGPWGLRTLTGKTMLGLLCLASAPTPVCAQRVAAQPTSAATPSAVGAPATSAPAVLTGSDQDAQQTREQLHRLLSEHPPTVREVLQRDPGLLSNAPYLATYPRLAAFVGDHPEIARAPVFFLGEPEPPHRQLQGSAWMIRELMDYLSVGILLLMGGLGFGWVVRTALDHRRWQRVSKIQVDTHSKLLDRLTSSEDLRAYMASPAGRQFLESAPIALDGQAAPIAAPVNRILWSLQVGVVTLLGGLGLAGISRTLADDASEPLRVLGVLLIAIGAGFLISAGLSYGLSRHLGLLRTGGASHGTAQSTPQV